MNTDLMSDETIAGISAPSLESEFVRPEKNYVWKLENGRAVELWPITAGSQILVHQASDLEDSGLVSKLAFLFLHAKRGEATAAIDRRRHVVPLAWLSRADFRASLLDWIDGLGPLSDGDKVAGIQLVNQMKTDADAALVVPAKTVGAKKKAARRRPR